MKTCFQPAAELSDVGPVALVSEQAQLFADKGTEPLWEEDLESQSHAAAAGQAGEKPRKGCRRRRVLKPLPIYTKMRAS